MNRRIIRGKSSIELPNKLAPDPDFCVGASRRYLGSFIWGALILLLACLPVGMVGVVGLTCLVSCGAKRSEVPAVREDLQEGCGQTPKVEHKSWAIVFKTNYYLFELDKTASGQVRLLKSVPAEMASRGIRDMSFIATGFAGGTGGSRSSHHQTYSLDIETASLDKVKFKYSGSFCGNSYEEIAEVKWGEVATVVRVDTNYVDEGEKKTIVMVVVIRPFLEEE